MLSVQYKFDFAPRTMLRLADIEAILKQGKIFKEIPSRKHLIELCEDGTFEAKLNRLGWLVFEDSFEEWLSELQQPVSKAA